MSRDTRSPSLALAGSRKELRPRECSCSRAVAPYGRLCQQLLNATHNPSLVPHRPRTVYLCSRDVNTAPLDEHVVHPAAATVHGDRDAGFSEGASKGDAPAFLSLHGRYAFPTRARTGWSSSARRRSAPTERSRPSTSPSRPSAIRTDKSSGSICLTRSSLPTPAQSDLGDGTCWHNAAGRYRPVSISSGQTVMHAHSL